MAYGPKDLGSALHRIFGGKLEQNHHFTGLNIWPAKHITNVSLDQKRRKKLVSLYMVLGTSPNSDLGDHFGDIPIIVRWARQN